MARKDDPTAAGDKPSVRQLLHAATGDRDAEAKALADRSDEEIDEAAAKAAVRRAEGDFGADEPKPAHDVASPTDARAEPGTRDAPDTEDDGR